jgi:hypothetical protein
VTIYSDCSGVLHTTATLLCDLVPIALKHSDILKNFVIHCSGFSFQCTLRHVKAHQDDNADLTTLTHPAQLTCACDTAAKRCLLEFIPRKSQPPYLFLLEHLSLIINNIKIPSDISNLIQHYAHKQEMQDLFVKLNVLVYVQFDKVAWELVDQTLHRFPKLFQMSVSKQVFNILEVLFNLSKQTNYSHLGKDCPSCT